MHARRTPTRAPRDDVCLMQEGLDLFGQVAVTWPEVVDWVARVAGITPDSPRWLPYVRSWRVAEKIAAAKISGQWDDSDFLPLKD